MTVDPVGLKKQLLYIFIMHKGRDPVKRRLGKLKAAPRIGEGEDPAVCPACGYELGKRAKTVYYVKRVIGLPGDVIDIIDDKVYLNGSETPLEEPYLAEEMNQGETMHFEVPEDCYFMMGDNRNFSADARYWKNPYISKDKLVAKVLFEYFPTPKIIH